MNIAPRALDFARAYREWLDGQLIEAPNHEAFGISEELASDLMLTIKCQRNQSPKTPKPSPACAIATTGTTTADTGTGEASEI